MIIPRIRAGICFNAGIIRICIDCGSPLIAGSGCWFCPSCGWSQCGYHDIKADKGVTL